MAQNFKNIALPVPIESREPTPEQTTELLEAFFRIADPAKKAELVATAERYAAKSQKFAMLMAKFAAKH